MGNITGDSENAKKLRGKRELVIKQVVLVLNLIGWEGSVSFLGPVTW